MWQDWLAVGVLLLAVLGIGIWGVISPPAEE
jgi:hypothetical protein